MNPEQLETDENDTESEIKNFLNLISRVEERKKLNERKEAVLMLGNTNSGKRTLTFFLADHELTSKKSDNTYRIANNDKRGMHSSSHTAFVNLIIDPSSKIYFYDLPGFEEARSPAQDIANAYFIKKVADSLNFAKLVLVIDHDSLTRSDDRQAFKRLLKHVTELIKDPEKFKDSFSLIATKVSNNCDSSGSCAPKTNDNIISDIADFLEKTKTDFQPANASPAEKNFFESAIKIINALLKENGGNYARIGIFRRPNEKGRLADIDSFKEAKKSLKKMIFDRTNFTKIESDDFGYIISDNSRDHLSNLYDKINDNISIQINAIVDKIKAHYSLLLKEIEDEITSLWATEKPNKFREVPKYTINSLINGFSIISNLAKKNGEEFNIEQFIKEIENGLKNLGIENYEDNLQAILKQVAGYKALEDVLDKKNFASIWARLFQTVATDLYSKNQTLERNIQQLETDLNNKINTSLENLSIKLHLSIENKVNSLALPQAFSELDYLYDYFNNIDKKFLHINNIETLVLEINDQTIRLNIQSSEVKQALISLSNYAKKLKFLDILSDGQLNTWSPHWLNKLTNIANPIKESRAWYAFLVSLDDKFSEYDIQKNKNNVGNSGYWGIEDKSTTINITKTNFQKFLENMKFMKLLKIKYDGIKHLEMTELRLKKINEVLGLALKSEPKKICKSLNNDSKKNELVIQGDYIKFSDFIDVNQRISIADPECDKINQNPLDSLKIFASKALFIDKSLNATGDKLKLSVIAPKWEIIGNPSIILDGKSTYDFPNNKTKANTDKFSLTTGDDGQPGLPGGAAGSFFGVGQRFINYTNLKITTNGGNGGPGQHGADGPKGKKGEDGEFNIRDTVATIRGKGIVPEHKNWMTDDAFGIAPGSKPYELYRLNGTPGGRGGQGGNGGVGGFGGNSGDVFIVSLGGENTLSFDKTGMAGQNGIGGSPGNGGNGGDGGKHKFVTCPASKRFCSLADVTQLANPGEPGCKGTTGANKKNIQSPDAASFMHNKAQIINDYKSYLRENQNDLKKDSVIHLLNDLEKNNNVKQLYNTLELVHELQGLEEQYHLLSDWSNEDWISFYQSLLNKIHTYKHANNSGSDNLAALDYLTGAIISKLNILASPTILLILNIPDYFKSAQKNIGYLKSLNELENRASLINERRAKFNQKFDERLDEAHNLVTNQIKPEIDKIFSEIEKHVNSLIDEILALQESENIRMQSLNTKVRELKNLLLLRSSFSTFRLASTFIPVSKTLIVYIESATAIGEAFFLHDQTAHGEKFSLPASVTSNIILLDTQIKEMKDTKADDLELKLTKITEEMKSSTLHSLNTKLIELKSELQSLKKIENWDDSVFNRLTELENRALDLIDQEIKALKDKKGDDFFENIKLSNDQTVKEAQILERVSKIVQAASIGSEFYNKYQDLQKKSNLLHQSIANSRDQFENLKQFERNIYQKMFPMLKNLKNSIDDIKNNTNNQSTVALDGMKWQMQSVIQDIMFNIRQLAEGFETKDSFVYYIERLYDAITISFDINKDIEDYLREQNSANHILDIISTSVRQINFRDMELDAELKRLESKIRSNAILEQYKEVITVFNQWVFPRAETYFSKFELPKNLQKNNKSLSNIAKQTAEELENISLIFDRYNLIATNDTVHIHTAYFNSQYDYTNPFFVWKNQTHNDMIADLLSGQPVRIMANLLDSRKDADAIKFNVIEINFKANDKEIQKSLDKTLNRFQASLTHSGNSYYRYADKVYKIIGPIVTIKYTFEKDLHGEPVDSNGMNSIKNAFLHSPYTTWNLQLINHNATWDDLEPFKNQVDLELVGRGRYISGNPFSKVEEYYKKYLVDSYDPVLREDDLLEIADVGISTKLRSDQTILTSYSHQQDGRHAIEEPEEYYQPLQQTSTNFSSYLKSPLVWIPLTLIATPLALLGMMTINKIRMRPNGRGAAINQPANFANPALAAPLLAVKSVEAKQSSASLDKQETDKLLPKLTEKKPQITKNKLTDGAVCKSKLPSQPFTSLPLQDTHELNSILQITHRSNLNSSQAKPNTPVKVDYSQIQLRGNYMLSKWLYGFFGSRSVLANINKAENISLTTTADQHLDEVTDRLNNTAETYGYKSFSLP